MRVAIVADIHGNRFALDAVLNDARALGVDGFWFIGDFCAIGPEPAVALGRVAALHGSLFTRGNTDRYVVTGDGPPPDLAAVRADPELAALFAELAASFAWTRGYLTATGWLDWLDGLPLEIRRTTPAGVRILAVHAAPGTDDGDGIHPGRSDAELRALVTDADADVLVVGHTHEAMARHLDGALVINVGSVSNPRAPDLRASYAILTATDTGVEVQHRRVAYDRDAFMQTVRLSRHPAADFILRHQLGAVPSRPPHPDHRPLTPGEPIVHHRRAPARRSR